MIGYNEMGKQNWTNPVMCKGSSFSVERTAMDHDDAPPWYSEYFKSSGFVPQTHPRTLPALPSFPISLALESSYGGYQQKDQGAENILTDKGAVWSTGTRRNALAVLRHADGPELFTVNEFVFKTPVKGFDDPAQHVVLFMYSDSPQQLPFFDGTALSAASASDHLVIESIDYERLLAALEVVLKKPGGYHHHRMTRPIGGVRHLVLVLRDSYGTTNIDFEYFGVAGYYKQHSFASGAFI